MDLWLLWKAQPELRHDGFGDLDAVRLGPLSSQEEKICERTLVGVFVKLLNGFFEIVLGHGSSYRGIPGPGRQGAAVLGLSGVLS